MSSLNCKALRTLLVHPVEALRLKMFIILELGDRRFDVESADSILELASNGGDHLVPFADRFRQLANVAVFPEMALVIDVDPGELLLLDGVEQFHDRRMTAHEIRATAGGRIARVLSFAKRTPAPIRQVGFQLAFGRPFDFNEFGIPAQAEVGGFAPIAGDRGESDDMQRSDLDVVVRVLRVLGSLYFEPVMWFTT